jgi:hypothetical protein
MRIWRSQHITKTLLSLLLTIPASAQVVTKVADLSFATGYGLGPLVQGFDGNLYAAASSGGLYGGWGEGTLFRVIALRWKLLNHHRSSLFRRSP